MEGIKLEGIIKSFGKKKALDDFSIEIPEGSFLCLLGPTGSGKTTLLKIVAGVETQDAGAVYLDSTDLTMLPPNKRPVSMVFENFALYPNMSVFKNIASPLLAKKLPKKEIERKVLEQASFLRIDKLLQRRIGQLSGGEMQRVAIARALCKEARVMLLDEIFVNLDYKLREEMRIEFRELMDKVKLTTIFSTPDPEDAFMLADRVAVIHDGKIIQYDTKDAVYNNPYNTFSGSYFGYPEMNLMDCRVTQKNGGLILESGLLQLSLKGSVLKDKLTIGTYTLGVRPEHIRISDNGKPTGELNGCDEHSVCSGTIVLTEVVGSDTIVHVRVADQTVEVFTPGIYRREVGETIYVDVDLRQIYVFDKESGELIGRGE
jgi:ABC-type sugar transport system ATPase subunit